MPYEQCRSAMYVLICLIKEAHVQPGPSVSYLRPSPVGRFAKGRACSAFELSIRRAKGLWALGGLAILGRLVAGKGGEKPPHVRLPLRELPASLQLPVETSCSWGFALDRSRTALTAMVATHDSLRRSGAAVNQLL